MIGIGLSNPQNKTSKTDFFGSQRTTALFEIIAAGSRDLFSRYQIVTNPIF
jgi:hypothetical protein